MGMEQAKRDMDAVARIGGNRIAAPPAGANNRAEIGLLEVTNRYRALLELGDQMGVIPIPPAMRMLRSAAATSGKLFLGLEISIRCPTRK